MCHFRYGRVKVKKSRRNAEKIEGGHTKAMRSRVFAFCRARDCGAVAGWVEQWNTMGVVSRDMFQILYR